MSGLHYKTEGTGVVLPAGALPPAGKLPEGATEHEILIRARAGAHEYMVKYPDGYTKQHMGHDVPKLLAKIMGVLRTRYGVGECSFLAVPKALEAGEKVIIGEVKYVS